MIETNEDGSVTIEVRVKLGKKKYGGRYTITARAAEAFGPSEVKKLADGYFDKIWNAAHEDKAKEPKLKLLRNSKE